MEPDSAVLIEWLKRNPPKAGLSFAARVTGLFERLNAQLRRELGANYQIGHSYFMVEQLDEPRLRMIWQHQIRPLIEEFYPGQANRVVVYDGLLENEKSRNRGE
jgi:hypothetical protein